MNKISCTSCRDELSAFADGEVEVTLSAEISHHLENCRSCRCQLDDIKSISKILVSGTMFESIACTDIWERMKSHVPSVCDVIDEDLSAYLDGELPAPAQEGVNKHLSQCNGCLQKFRLLNESNTFIASKLTLPSDIKVDLWPSVKARLDEDCALIQSELSAYADQEVVTLRHRTITSHLVECEKCRDHFSRLSFVADIVRESFKPTIPDDFDLWPSIKRKLQVVPFASKTTAQKVPVSNFRRRMYLSAAVAAAVAVVVGIAGLLTFSLLPFGHRHIEPMTSEAYLIESAFTEPIKLVDAVVLEEQ